jgi:hypothetical protein
VPLPSVRGNTFMDAVPTTTATRTGPRSRAWRRDGRGGGEASWPLLVLRGQMFSTRPSDGGELCRSGRPRPQAWGRDHASDSKASGTFVEG